MEVELFAFVCLENFRREQASGDSQDIRNSSGRIIRMTHIFLAILSPKIKEFFLLMIHCKYFFGCYTFNIYIKLNLSISILIIDSDIYVCYYIVTHINRNT